MRTQDAVEIFEKVISEVKFAQHVHGRLTELRTIDESDLMTFDRCMEELLNQKYPGRIRGPNNGPGVLEVGLNEKKEVVINLPKDMTGHIVFSIAEARVLALVLLRTANEGEER
jgi:hypothetical protein